MSLPDRVAAGLLALGAWVLAALFIGQVVTVALRYVFATGWTWLTDLLIYLFLISAVLPASAVVLRNLSVRVDVFYAGWRSRVRRGVDRAALLLLLFPAMSYAAYAAFRPMLTSWRILESSPNFGGMPGYFALKTLVFLTFVLLAALALWMGLRREPYRENQHES